MSVAINWELANWPKNQRRALGVDGAEPVAVCGWCVNRRLLSKMDPSRITHFGPTDDACYRCRQIALKQYK